MRISYEERYTFPQYKNCLCWPSSALGSMCTSPGTVYGLVPIRFRVASCCAYSLRSLFRIPGLSLLALSSLSPTARLRLPVRLPHLVRLASSLAPPPFSRRLPLPSASNHSEAYKVASSSVSARLLPVSFLSSAIPPSFLSQGTLPSPFPLLRYRSSEKPKTGFPAELPEEKKKRNRQSRSRRLEPCLRRTGDGHGSQRTVDEEAGELTILSSSPSRVLRILSPIFSCLFLLVFLDLPKTSSHRHPQQLKPYPGRRRRTERRDNR